MIIERKEAWGKLRYDISQHRFSCVHTDEKDATPYTDRPVVLNVDLTMKCNMDCIHCVAKDYPQIEDLVISRKLLDWINREDFMVVVITGGEPLLPEYEKQLMTLLRGIRGKGLVIDTNGTIFPSRSVIETILDTSALVRVSWDSTRVYDETCFRRARSNKSKYAKINKEYFDRKPDTILRLRDAGVSVAAQTVVHKENSNLHSLGNMPDKLREFSIKQWYLQRFIPSRKAIGENLKVSNEKYDEVTAKLIEICHEKNIECITKKDRRHNCVVLLVGDGVLFTQGEKPREKIPLGTIDSKIRYFDYMSSADHAERYYG
jgi:MoaA/NifB/PqqE/SkfB family radical SAM enzyme